MRKVQLYDFETKFNFGQHNGQTIKEVFEKTPSYISWCFQKVDGFCISDEIFNKLPIIVSLKKENKIDNIKEQKDWLKILTDLHHSKKANLNVSKNQNIENLQNDVHINYDWLKEASGTDDPETMNDVYWNLD